ncbi:phage tail tape measure protein [Desulfovibrio mangrovi]|uniref:phage tail tape measure protein n=1 Tax=Desulfovibrio mangrovi TaxID=2976983 RepID=UPI0022468209|nr:phage tail tape measure protein [Desulfovibrio mangrovi]UZP67652.1 phage tail tape measure protein [Desulfovibrio mangrovi]
MADIKTIGLSFAIGTTLMGGFDSNLTRAERGLKRMGNTVAKLESQAPLKLGQSFETMRGKLVNSRKALSAAERELESLNAEAERSGGVHGFLAHRIASTEKRIGSLSRDVDRNRRAFRSNLVEMDRQGFSVKSLRSEYGRLGDALDKSRAKYDRFAASMAKSKGYADKRAELRGGVMDVAAMGATMAAPMVLGSREEDSQIRLEDALNADNKQAAMMEAQKHARGLARTGIVDLTGAYDIQYALNSAGLDASTARIGSTVVAKVAKITNGSAEGVGEVIATAYNNLGKSLGGTADENMQRIGDLLTKTQLKFQFRDFSQLGESLNEAASGFASYKVNLEQGLTLLGQLNTAGVKGSSAGTAFNAVLRQLGKAQQKWGIEIVRTKNGELDMLATLKQVDEALGGMDTDARAQALQEVFGDEGRKGIAPLLESLKDLPAALKDVRDNSRGIMDARMDRHLKASSTQWKSLTNNLTILGSTVGSTLLPVLNQGVQLLNATLIPLADFVAEHETLTAVIGSVVMGMMAFKVASFAGRYAATFFGDGIQMANRATMVLGMRQRSATVSTTALSFAQRRAAITSRIMGSAQRNAAMGSTLLSGGIRMVGAAIKGAFMANPIGAAIMAIMTLWELGSALYESWEPFRKLIDWIWEGLGKVGDYIKGMPVIGDVIGFFSGDGKTAAPSAKVAAPRMGDSLPDVPELDPMPGMEAAINQAPTALSANAPVTISIQQEFTIASGDAGTVKAALDSGKRELEATVERLIDNYFRKQRRVSLA